MPARSINLTMTVTLAKNRGKQPPCWANVTVIVTVMTMNGRLARPCGGPAGPTGRAARDPADGTTERERRDAPSG
jgi:hypothetical protein